MKSLLLSLTLIILIISANGQTGFSPPAPTAGLAGSCVTRSDLWSAMHNQAGLGLLTHSAAGITAENRWGMDDLVYCSAAGAAKLPAGALSLVHRRLFNSTYKNDQTSIGYGLALGKNLSAGVSFSVFTLATTESLQRTSALSADAGLIGTFSERLRLGVHCTNINDATLREGQATIPLKWSTGLQYSLSDNITFLAQLDQQPGYGLQMKGGLECRSAKKIWFRYGIRSNPWLSSAGLGFQRGIFHVDMAGAFSPELGVSPAISLSIQPGQ